EEAEFGPLDQKQAGGAVARDLPDELRADRAARAGHHHDASEEEFSDHVLVELNPVPSEQVLDLDVANPRHFHLPLQHLVEARNDPDLHGDRAADLEEPEDLAAPDAGDRDDDLGDAELLDEPGKVARRSEDADPLDFRTDLAVVVVDETL